MAEPTPYRPTDSLRLLCVSSSEPSWIGITIQLNYKQVREPHYRWSSTPHEALTILRREIFDAILIVKDVNSENDSLEVVNILQLLEAMRTSGHDEPVVVVINQLGDEEWAEMCQRGCDIILSERNWNTPALVPSLLRSVKRNELQRSNQRIEAANRKLSVREKTETQTIFTHLQQIIHDRELLQRETHSSEFPEEVKDLYGHLLRTFCMMGEGTLTAELSQLTKILTTANATTAEVLKMHVEQTQELVAKLGSRGSRHVLVRSDLLIIELLVHLGDEFYSYTRS
ncbi:hypothetical protein OAF24_00770 [bacterium]|nr:hypothetical protein [bacterium]